MKTQSLVLAAALAAIWSGSALAKSAPSPVSDPVTPIPPARTLAGDVQVINPPPAAPPALPQPPGTTVVVPTQEAPVAPPPAPAPRTQKVVNEEVTPSHNYMGTIALSALMGGVAGALIGGAIYYLGDQQHARNIGFWAAGGVLAGTAVGVVQVVVQEDRASEAVSSRGGSPDPASTHRLALLRLHF
jgi:hypothetical protein